MALTAKTAFLMTFAFAFLVTFLVGLAFVTPFAFVLSIFGYGSGALYLVAAVAAFFVSLVFGFVGLLMFYVWRALPRGIQVVLILAVLVFGVALVQPEIEVLAVVGVILTLGGVNNGQKALVARR